MFTPVSPVNKIITLTCVHWLPLLQAYTNSDCNKLLEQ